MEHHYEQILDIYENDVLEGCIPGKINCSRGKKITLLQGTVPILATSAGRGFMKP